MLLSPLERLPLELIEPIFLQSDINLALIDASPYIATKLSNKYIYRKVCIYYLTEAQFGRRRQIAAQTRIFNTQWMTWDFFKLFILTHYDAKKCLCARKGSCIFPSSQWPPDFKNATGMLWDQTHKSSMAVLECHFPTKMLQSPWTEENIQFLRFLLKASNMTADFLNQRLKQRVWSGVAGCSSMSGYEESGNVHTKLGWGAYMDAIMSKNLAVVQLFSEHRQLAEPPDISLVRFAAIEAGCDRSIVFDLLSTARAYSNQRDAQTCSELDEWCKQGINQGNPKAKWLQTKLEELKSTPKWVVNSEIHGANLDPRTGDYDGGKEDVLVVTKDYPRQIYISGKDFERLATVAEFYRPLKEGS